jgi:hypothetical protein
VVVVVLARSDRRLPEDLLSVRRRRRRKTTDLLRIRFKLPLLPQRERRQRSEMGTRILPPRDNKHHRERTPVITTTLTVVVVALLLLRGPQMRRL